MDESVPVPRKRNGFPFVRVIALLILTAALTAIYWIPFVLLGPVAAAAVLAIVTMACANLASRLHAVTVRVTALEARPEAPAPPASPQK